MRYSVSRCFVAIFSLLALSVTAFGETLDPDEALARALGSGRGRNAFAGKEAGYKLVFTQDMPTSGDAGVYVFTTGDDFVAVSADDCAVGLLGYADKRFDPQSMPPAMAWWLGEYAREIECAAQTGLKSQAYASVTDNKKPIAPMLSTQWGQDAPYNNLCPVINGERSVTGCVATAMAQVMRYHKYPAVGKGTVANSSSGATLQLSTLPFDWDNMSDRYTSTSTEAQNSAVAVLMYAAGMAVNMNYSPYASSAANNAIAPALVEYFGYDKSAYYASRCYHGLQEWIDLVYDQLVNYGPVQYQGLNSNNGGHAFVCDGYSSDGFFHFNWGWKGLSDGYFKLTALNPGSQGIGGSAEGYNYNQSIVANVCPPRENSVMTPYICMNSGISITPLVGISAGGNVTVTSVYANFSSGTVKGAPGLKFSAEDGTERYSQVSSGLISEMTPNRGVSNVRLSTPQLGDGVYKVTPAFYMSGENRWVDVHVEVGYVSSYTLTVTDGRMKFAPATAGTVTIDDVKVNSAMYFGENFKVSAMLTNTGGEEYMGSIRPALFNGNTLVAYGARCPVDIPAGGSEPLTMVDSFISQSTQTEGEYKFMFVDGLTGAPLSAPVSVYVRKSPGKAVLSMSDFKLVENTGSSDPLDLVFEGVLACQEGYYSGPLSVYVFPENGGSCLEIFSGCEEAYFISEGESVRFRAEGKFSSGVAGARYMAIPGWADDSIHSLLDRNYFFIIETSGIEEIGAAEGESVYYNMQGVRVDNPGPGLYIRVTGGKACKVRL